MISMEFCVPPPRISFYFTTLGLEDLGESNPEIRRQK